MKFRITRKERSWDGRPERTGYIWVRFQPTKPSKRKYSQDGQVREEKARDLAVGMRVVFVGYDIVPIIRKTKGKT